jgi:hypothetical protein
MFFILIAVLSGLIAAVVLFWEQGSSATFPGTGSIWGYFLVVDYFIVMGACLAAVLLYMSGEHYTVVVSAQPGAPADAPKATRR